MRLLKYALIAILTTVHVHVCMYFSDNVFLNAPLILAQLVSQWGTGVLFQAYYIQTIVTLLLILLLFRKWKSRSTYVIGAISFVECLPLVAYYTGQMYDAPIPLHQLYCLVYSEDYASLRHIAYMQCVLSVVQVVFLMLFALQYFLWQKFKSKMIESPFIRWITSSLCKWHRWLIIQPAVLIVSAAICMTHMPFWESEEMRWLGISWLHFINTLLLLWTIYIVFSKHLYKSHIRACALYLLLNGGGICMMGTEPFISAAPQYYAEEMDRAKDQRVYICSYKADSNSLFEKKCIKYDAWAQYPIDYTSFYSNSESHVKDSTLCEVRVNIHKNEALQKSGYDYDASFYDEVYDNDLHSCHSGMRLVSNPKVNGWALLEGIAGDDYFYTLLSYRSTPPDTFYVRVYDNRSGMAKADSIRFVRF